MSTLPRCWACGWHPAYRNRLAARRAVRTHVCHPTSTRRAAR